MPDQAQLLQALLAGSRAGGIPLPSQAELGGDPQQYADFLQMLLDTRRRYMAEFERGTPVPGKPGVRDLPGPAGPMAQAVGRMAGQGSVLGGGPADLPAPVALDRLRMDLTPALLAEQQPQMDRSWTEGKMHSGIGEIQPASEEVPEQMPVPQPAAIAQAAPPQGDRWPAPGTVPPGWPRRIHAPGGGVFAAEEGSDETPNDVPQPPPQVAGLPAPQSPQARGAEPFRLPDRHMGAWPIQQAMMASNVEPEHQTGREAEMLNMLVESRRNPRFFGPEGMRPELGGGAGPAAAAPPANGPVANELLELRAKEIANRLGINKPMAQADPAAVQAAEAARAAAAANLTRLMEAGADQAQIDAAWAAVDDAEGNVARLGQAKPRTLQERIERG